MAKNIIRSPSEYAADKAREEQDRLQLRLVDTRVLLVEDNPVNQRAVIRLLERYGCGVVLANHGVEALQILRKDHAFDLVFMDCQMPVMDGYAATRAIRQMERDNPEWPRLTVVAFTAHLPQLEQQKCTEAGMDDYLEKPVERTLFEQGLLRWVPATKHRNVAVDSVDVLEVAVPPRVFTQSHPVLNEEIFMAFCELMGDEAAEVLEKHCANILRYIAQAEDGVTRGDAEGVSRALHPLKSASRQIGAFGVADIAGRAEKEAQQPTPVNFAAIALMLHELAAMQLQLEEFIQSRKP